MSNCCFPGVIELGPAQLVLFPTPPIYHHHPPTHFSIVPNLVPSDLKLAHPKPGAGQSAIYYYIGLYILLVMEHYKYGRYILRNGGGDESLWIM